MRKILGIFIIFISFCSKNTEPEYVIGEVIIHLKDSTSFFDVYLMASENGLKIEHVCNFTYRVNVDSQKVEDIENIIRNKKYLNTYGHHPKFSYDGSVLKTYVSFFDIDPRDAEDWFKTVDSLNLEEDFEDIFFFKWGVLKVPIGTEHYWAEKLEEYPFVTMASLNSIIYAE